MAVAFCVFEDLYKVLNGTQADSFGCGPLDLHGKMRLSFFSVDF